MLRFDEVFISSNVKDGRLDLTGHSIGDDGVKALAASLATDETVTYLDLTYNSINDDGAKALATSLTTNITLNDLYLNNNNIGDDGAKALAALLDTNHTITYLYLGDNNVSAEQMAAIKAALVAKENLPRTSMYLAQRQEAKRLKALRDCMCALSFQQLLELEKKVKLMFPDDFELKTMRDINEAIITPECQKTKKSYALSRNPEGLKAEVYVTHSWDGPFVSLVESIRQAFLARLNKPTMWIYAVSMPQGTRAEIGAWLGTAERSLKESPFVMALKGATTYLVVRNCNTDLCGRIWCVCEITYAKKFGFIPSRTLVTGTDTFAAGSASCLDAESSDPGDKVKILRELLNNHSRAEIDGCIDKFRTFYFV